eukprot:jgi/Botrbrau1/3438/Bobra.139_1s0018.1
MAVIYMGALQCWKKHGLIVFDGSGIQIYGLGAMGSLKVHQGALTVLLSGITDSQIISVVQSIHVNMYTLQRVPRFQAASLSRIHEGTLQQVVFTTVCRRTAVCRFCASFS